MKFEEIWKDLMSYENSLPFQKPVSTKIAPDYYQIIRNPMDLSRVKDRIKGIFIYYFYYLFIYLFLFIIFIIYLFIYYFYYFFIFYLFIIL